MNWNACRVDASARAGGRRSAVGACAIDRAIRGTARRAANTGASCPVAARAGAGHPRSGCVC